MEQLNKLETDHLLAIEPLIDNYQLMKDFNLKVFIKEKKIYVLISLDNDLGLYEILVFPHIRDTNVITLENLPNYLLVSKNHGFYKTLDRLACKTVQNRNICKPLPLIELYLKNQDRFCEYRKLNINLDIMHKINNFQLECTL